VEWQNRKQLNKGTDHKKSGEGKSKAKPITAEERQRKIELLKQQIKAMSQS